MRKTSFTMICVILAACLGCQDVFADGNTADVPPDQLNLSEFAIQERLKDIDAKLLVLKPEYERLEQKIQSGTTQLEDMRDNEEANTRLHRINQMISVQKNIGAQIILLTEEKARITAR